MFKNMNNVFQVVEFVYYFFLLLNITFRFCFISIYFNILVLTLAAVPAPPTTDTAKETTIGETESITTLLPPSPTELTTGV